MIEEVYWRTLRPTETEPPLTAQIEADAVVVGGGIAGLSAAQWLREEGGRDVVVLEAGECGAGATGKSSGFITPDSELGLHELSRRFGEQDAKALWDGVWAAVRRVRENIDRFHIDCDRTEADSLFVASTRGAASDIRAEHEAHERLGYASRYCARDELPGMVGTGNYHAGIRTGGTFSMNAYHYAQGLKRALAGLGARVFEQTPAVEIGARAVRTPRGVVRARQVFVCVDRFAPSLGVGTDDVYHAQTFIALTEPLDDATLRRAFPGGPLLVWDTDLVYQYFRRTVDNRLLVGGGKLRYTFAPREVHGESAAVRSLVAYTARTFPYLRGVRFTHFWPGLIGVTKDLLPIAGAAPGAAAHFHAMCSAGLPWSTLAGRVAAQRAVEGSTPFDRFFAPGRAFTPLDPLQPVLGKPLTFALATYFSKGYERGAAAAVARQQRLVRASALAAAGTGLGALAGLLARNLWTGSRRSR